MGYEPFQSHTAERNGCLGNKTGQSVAHTLPRASNLFSKWRLEQVANLDDGKNLYLCNAGFLHIHLNTNSSLFPLCWKS